MKQVTWILEQTKFANDFDSANRIGYIVEEKGHKSVSFQYVPFGGTDYLFLNEVQNPCVFFGSYGGMKHLQEYLQENPQIEAQPHIWYDYYTFSCLNYYKELGPSFIFQQQYEFLTFSQVSREIHRLCNKFNSDSIFLKPNLNIKEFTGNIISLKDNHIWLKHLKDYNQLSDDLLCVAAKPQKIDAEWRFIVSDGKVITGSQYRDGVTIDVRPEYPEEAAQVATFCAKVWNPFPIFVIDICLAKGEYWVVEVGSWNFAGLYRCDLVKIVETIHSILLK